MRVKIPLKNDVVVLEENIAYLDATTSNQTDYYVYKIQYAVDAVKAIKHKSLVVQLNLSRNPPNKFPAPIVNDVDNPTGLSGLEPYDVLEELRKRNQNVKDVIRSNRSDFFFQKLSDWTAFISNEKTNNIIQALRSGGTITYKTKKSSLKNSVREFLKSNNTPPILANQTIMPSDAIPVGDNLFKTMAQEMLLINRTHPATFLANKQNSIISATQSSAGTKSKYIKHQSTAVGAMIEGAINSYGTVDQLDYTSVPEESVVSIPVIEEEKYVMVDEVLEIPKSLLGTNIFYISFDLTDSKGNLVQRITKMVNHPKNIASLTVPKKVPVLEVVTAGVGRNIITIKDVGGAVGVRLYRKIDVTSSPNKSAEYAFIGRVEYINTGNIKARTVNDLCDNYNPVTYRAVPYGEDGINSSVFATATTTPVSLPFGLIQEPVVNKRKHVGLSHEIEKQGIRINVSDIPAGTIEIQLLKKDNLEDQSPEKPVGRNVFTGDMKTQVSILDSFVYPGHIYEYRCKLIDRYGNVVDGSTTMIVEYTPEISTFIQTTIQDMKVTQGNELDVQFNINTNFVLEQEETIRKTLENQGLLSYFGNDVSVTKLQQLVAYNVVRTNITTGEVEDFGIITTNIFSDISLGRPKGVVPLKNGDVYRYSVTTMLLDPNTSLREKLVTVQTGTNRSYTYKPFFWEHPLALKTGTLTTDASIKNITAKSDFTLGEVGSIVSATISLEDVLPSVVEATATKVNVLSPKMVRVTWKVNGLATKFDHFIVLQEHLGMVTRVGCVHNLTNNNLFEFYDELVNNEEGELSYVIVPIYYDFAIGKTTNSNKLVI